jgi:hypothetical protein
VPKYLLLGEALGHAAEDELDLGVQGGGASRGLGERPGLRRKADREDSGAREW